MSELISLLAAVAVGASGIVALYRQLQMLQQNSYFPSRYMGWIKESFTIPLALEAILFCFLTLLYTNSKSLLTLLVCLALLGIRIPVAISQNKKSIKKLVLTARIKRLFVCAFVLVAALILGFALLGDTLSMTCRMLLFAASVVSPVLTLACWALTAPIEKAVARFYINDAKRILREHKGLKVIGVTGSYGKTSTKFILQRILNEKFNTVATPQSFNTPMGVVRTVRGDIKPQTQVFICEMGAKNIGDIKEICDIAHPQFGIITSVGAQHLDTFKTVDNVYKTKFELYDEIKKQNGLAFINASSPEIAARLENTPDALKYGLDTSCDYYAENIVCDKNGSSFDLILKGEVIPVSTRLLGTHNVINIVTAAAIGYEMGVSAAEIRFAISSLKPTEHRLELKPWNNGSLLIDDAYNANPEGSIEAVKVLKSFEGMRKVIITPGLIELGDREYDCNYNLGLAAAKCCDEIILVGKNRSKPLQDAVGSTDFPKDKLFVVSSFAEAMQIYLPTADKNSVVLIENDLPDNYLN